MGAAPALLGTTLLGTTLSLTTLGSSTYLPLAIVLRVGDADPRVETDEHVHARAGRAERLQRRRLVDEERVPRQPAAGAARVVCGGEQLHHLQPLHEARAAGNGGGEGPDAGEAAARALTLAAERIEKLAAAL